MGITELWKLDCAPVSLEWAVKEHICELTWLFQKKNIFAVKSFSFTQAKKKKKWEITEAALCTKNNTFIQVFSSTST